MFLKMMSNEKAKLFLGVMLPYCFANLATVFVSSWSSALAAQHTTNAFCNNSTFICDQYNSSLYLSGSNMTLSESVLFQSGVMNGPLAYYLLLGIATAVFSAVPYCLENDVFVGIHNCLQSERQGDELEGNTSISDSSQDDGDSESESSQKEEEVLEKVSVQGVEKAKVNESAQKGVSELTERTALLSSSKLSFFTDLVDMCEEPLCSIEPKLETLIFLMGVFGNLISAVSDAFISSTGATDAICPTFSPTLTLCNETFSQLNGTELNLVQDLLKEVSGSALGYGLLSAIVSAVVTSAIAHFASIAIIAFLDRYCLTEDDDIEMSVHSSEGSYDTSTSSSIDYSV